MKAGRVGGYTAKLRTNVSAAEYGAHAYVGDSYVTPGAKLAREVISHFALRVAAPSLESKKAFEGKAVELAVALVGMDSQLFAEITAFLADLRGVVSRKKSSASRGRVMGHFFVNYCRSTEGERKELINGVRNKRSVMLMKSFLSAYGSRPAFTPSPSEFERFVTLFEDADSKTLRIWRSEMGISPRKKKRAIIR